MNGERECREKRLPMEMWYISDGVVDGMERNGRI